MSNGSVHRLEMLLRTVEGVAKRRTRLPGLVRSGLRRFWVLSLCVAPTLCSQAPEALPPTYVISIPAQSDWIDIGPIFERGAEDEWDHYLWGGFGGTAIKMDGTYYLYYQGARGYRTTPDETVTERAIGVATSDDGINFTKYRANPVITWSPYSEGEEGATSAAAVLVESEKIVLYYGANTAVSPTLVNADGRLAISTDGVHFADKGIALHHRRRSLWGSGDELFPIIALYDAGRWFVYYLPNGTLQSRQLGVAWGNARDNLNRSSAATSGGSRIRAWGMGGSARIGPGVYALFLNDVTERKTEVRVVSLDTPNRLSAPIRTYRFDEVVQATVLLDEEANTWLMYYRGEDAYGVKLASVNALDNPLPTAPDAASAVSVSDRRIDLPWWISAVGRMYDTVLDGVRLRCGVDR